MSESVREIIADIALFVLLMVSVPIIASGFAALVVYILSAGVA